MTRWSVLLVALIGVAGCSMEDPSTEGDDVLQDTRVSGDTTGEDSTRSDGDVTSGPCDFLPGDYGVSCSSASDCIVALHQLDCCGSRTAVGLSASERDRFDTAEAACVGSLPQCDCPTQMTTAEDGHAGSESDIFARCDAGECQTWVRSPDLQCAGIPDSFDKTCTTEKDCFVAFHQINCCGTFVAVGLSTAVQTSFESAESLCQESYPLCGCASMPTVAEDDNTGPHEKILARCANDQCESYVLP